MIAGVNLTNLAAEISNGLLGSESNSLSFSYRFLQLMILK